MATMRNPFISFIPIVACSIYLSLMACQQSTTSDLTSPGFELVSPQESHIGFSNTLTENLETRANLFDFDYFYNGAGVGLADFDNDGLLDIVFAANQAGNEIYRNVGGMSFEKQESAFSGLDTQTWSNGISIVDINEDGLLDIYISHGGPHRAAERENRLWINQGNFQFEDQANEYGLNDQGFSTQSVFFDFDKDGDLDCFVMNENPLFGKGPVEFYQLLGDNPTLFYNSSSHFYENQNGTYVDVSEKVGVLKPSFGLGLQVSDINNDGWLDIYVANDYYIPDAMYINQGNGTFEDEIKQRVKQTEFYGMGLDIADLNQDGHLDLVVLDMASEDHFRSKTLMPSMDVESFDLLTKTFQFPYQYMFNAVQLNSGRGSFDNIAHYTGMAKTDWSWAALVFDADHNIHQEVLVTNGYRRYALDNDFRTKVVKAKSAYEGKVPLPIKKELYRSMPSEKLANVIFSSTGSLKFTDISSEMGLIQPSFSNGAAYGDLDNDGDLDLVINNIDDTAFVYRNLATENGSGNFFKVSIEDGPSEHYSKVTIFYDGQFQTKEISRVRGYMSSVENVAHFGIGEYQMIDSMVVHNTYGSTTLYDLEANQMVNVSIGDLQPSQPIVYQNGNDVFTDLEISGLDHIHEENYFNDFGKEILLPYKQSSIGPCLEVGDINGDGLDDVFVGGSKQQSGRIYIQKDDYFESIDVPVLIEDAKYEDVAASLFDADDDGDLDLYVVSGGNETISWKDYTDRLYINDGTGNFSSIQESLFEELAAPGGVVLPIDYDQDDDLDLFIGNRIHPQGYPNHAPSYLLENQDGQFTNVTDEKAEMLADFGIINDAITMDYNKDGKPDLVVCGEWTPIGVFKNTGIGFEDVTKDVGLSDYAGWWFHLESIDVNNDGKPELIAGNLGKNSKYKATSAKPLRVYANDFDQNGSLDIVLSTEYQGRAVPVRGRECSSEQMPFIAEKFPTFEEFANASLEDIFGPSIDSSNVLSANTFESILISFDDLSNTRITKLPEMAQLSPILDAEIMDIDQDGDLDAILVGNIYDTEVETPRLDFSSAIILWNEDGEFSIGSNKQSMIPISGDAKDVEFIQLDEQSCILVSVNDGELLAKQLVRTIN